MRHENLSDSSQLMWKLSRDHSRAKASRQRNSETSWRRTKTTSLAVSFGSYRRRRIDVLMGRHGHVPLRPLGDVPLRRRCTAHKMKSFIKDFFSKCDQIHRKL